MAVIHFKLKISFKTNGQAKLATLFAIYNPRVNKATIENFQILRDNSEGIVGGFNEYKWDATSEVEKQITD